MTRNELSQREREVLALAAEGLTDDQIGKRIDRTRETVARNLGMAYRKLAIPTGLSTHARTRAVALAVARGLITVQESAA